MNAFAERMKSLTEHLTDSTREREESLDRVREATGSLLEGAREFVVGVVRDHGSMAHELHETMSTNRAEQVEKAQALRSRHRESLEQMRTELRSTLTTANQARHDAMNQLHEGFQASRDRMRTELRSSLSTANQARHDAVSQLHEGFQVAQHELAEDLSSAARVWREFASSR